MNFAHSVLKICLMATVLGSATVTGASPQKVNPQLAERMKLYEREELVELGDRVHVAFGYEYSNYAYIEGDDGVILVDSGWFPGQAKRSIADYRRLVSDKPLVAIIYTHMHPDHTGGASAIMAGENPDIPVYGPPDWQRWINESVSNYRPALYRRIFMQMGLLLPRGEDGTVGNGLNPSPRADGKPRLDFPPTVAVADTLEVTISGVRIQMMPVEGDIPENLFVWLPDDQILFTGDTPMHGTFPAIETARYEADRDPRALYASMDKVLELDPEYVVCGHGRIMIGREDVIDVAIANRDITQFMVDQLDRLYVKGLSPDQVVDTLKLPPKLADHPDLQPYYHRVEWMIRQMYVKRGGFVGGPMDFVTLTSREEARRLVPLLGGAAAVRRQARTALEDEPRWAARLASFALELDPDDTQARTIRQEAFLRVARTTVSANERNYLLSTINEENGKYDWRSLFAESDYEAWRGQQLDVLLQLMQSRFRAEDADNLELTVALSVSGKDRILQIRNNILIPRYAAGETVDTRLEMDRDTLDRIAANMTTWSAALSAGDISVSLNPEIARQFVALIE